jgi:hypothetical protein
VKNYYIDSVGFFLQSAAVVFFGNINISNSIIALQEGLQWYNEKIVILDSVQ